MRTLYVQKEPGYPISPDIATFLDAVEQDTWLRGERMYQIKESSKYAGHITSGTDPKSVIPIGAIEFIQKFLIMNDLPPLPAINIPSELESKKYLGRKVWHLENLNELRSREEFDIHEFLVKPDRTPKLFGTTTTSWLGDVPPDEPLFVSEMLKGIQAEWRAFVLRGEIKSIHPYSLKEWVFPDRPLVEEMAKMVKLPACTIDIAVLANRKTVLIEVHPFISCGLYGFDGPDLLRMASTAWAHHLQYM